MTFRLKTLGLATIAVLAMSAMFVSAAQAQTQFTASSATWATAPSAQGNEVFSTEGGDVECAGHFSGKVASSTTTITITASYYECEAFGLGEATVINGCDYVFHSNEELDLECPSTNKLVVVAGNCEIQVGTQTGLKTIDFANGSGDITAKASITGLKYNVTKDGFGCPFAGTGARSGGEYRQTSAVTIQSTGGASIGLDTPPPPGESFTANSYPTTVTATSPLGNDIITVDGSSQECSTHLVGTFVEQATTLTLNPTYTNCRAFGFATATYTMNGCAYVLHGNGELDLECPPGESMVVTAGNCEVRIGAQSGLKSVKLTNNGNHVDLQLGITGMTVSVTKDGFLCPLAGTGHKTATYVQVEAITVKPVSGGTAITLD